MKADTVVRRTDSLSSVDVNGESVILNVDSGTYFGLDGVGARIWSLLESPVTYGELVRVVLNEYEVDRDTAESDIADLVRELEQKGLVETGA
jgi:hypothetical protein